MRNKSLNCSDNEKIGWESELEKAMMSNAKPFSSPDFSIGKTTRVFLRYRKPDQISRIAGSDAIACLESGSKALRVEIHCICFYFGYSYSEELNFEEMYGGDNRHPIFPFLLEENCSQYGLNASSQLQLFGNFPAGYSVDPVNCLGNKHLPALSQPTKRVREGEDISRQQKLCISLNNNFHQDEADRSAIIPNANPISTGLRLLCDDDEHNPTVVSASGSMAADLPVILSLGDNLQIQIDQQKEEYDHYIRVQEERMAKGVWEMRQKHMASILGAIERAASKKLREKEVEIDNMNHKNGELVMKIKQVAMEAQSWHYRAKYNEFVVNVLKNNLRLAIARCADQGKHGCGDSEVDDAASSYICPNNNLSFPNGASKPANGTPQGLKEQMTCKACKGKEVSILLLPCRHLCLCKDCEGLLDVCPVCQSVKTASFQVYMS